MSISEAHPRATERKHSPQAPHEPGKRPASSIAPLLRYLEKLTAEKFFGRVVVSFQNGKVHDVKIEETKKMDEL